MAAASSSKSPGATAAAGVAAGVAWLVDGDDPSLVAEEVRRLVGTLAGDDPALTVEDFWGEEVDLDAVVLACETPPFLADRRVVVLRDAGRFSTEELTGLLTYLDNPLPTTALVLAGGGGKLAPKLVASVKKVGHVVGTGPGRDGKGWIEARLKRAPLQFEPAARTLLATHLGEDLGRLPAMLDTLVASYGEGARLTPEDLAPFLGEAGGVAPWDLTDAIDRGDAAAALETLHRLLGAGDRHPLVVLAILHRHLAAMLTLDGAGPLSEAQAAERLGIAKGRSTFPARKALNGARNLGTDGTARAIALLAAADVDLRGESTWPGDAVLEVLVARLARLAPRSNRAGGGARRRG
jgi:DNA polymerase-3 subunit delta